MTVTSATARASYAGNGVTTAFTVPFRFLENSHVRVTLISSAGVETDKTLTTHYTVAGAGDATGTVTMITAPASGETLLIRRNVPVTQVTNYVNGDRFPADSHENALDKLTMIAQQFDDRLDTTEDAVLELVTDVAINVMSYWLPSHTDHTTAIDAAFAASKASLTYDADREVSRAARQTPVYFPPGDYTYSGTGVDLGGSEAYVLAYTKTPQAAKIKVTSDVFLIRTDDYVLGTLFKNFHIVGGKGALRYTKTGENVAELNAVKDNVFDGYTVCAVSNESSDHPFWQVERNIFHGADGSSTIGVALGGYLDCSYIRDNQFEGNAYNIKVGGYLSGNIEISGNGFLRWPGSADRVADIWLVPSTEAFAVNSGFATTIRNNKFGNENLAADDVRILVAAEGSGADRATKVHSTTFYTTGHYFSGVTLDGNRISGVPNGTAPFIKSYIENLNNWTYGQNNKFDGGTYTYLLEYMGALAESDAYVTRNNRFEIGASQYSARPFTAGVSNYRTGVVVDPFGLYATDDGVVIPGVGDDVGVTILANGRYSDITVFGGASKAAATDVYGGTETAEITFASASADNGAAVVCAEPVAEVLSWLEVELAVGATLSVFTLGVQIANTTTGAIAKKLEGLTLYPNPRTVRVPFFFPTSTDPTDWVAKVYATDFSGGARTKAKVARFKVYQARAPFINGHLRTLGDGTWDTGHIVLGTHHIWVDSTGDLRIKGSAPTSDTDGTVVGTQS